MPISDLPGAEVNTLVTGNPILPECRVVGTVQRRAVRTGSDGYVGNVIINGDGASSGNGEVNWYFRTPPGCTGVRMALVDVAVLASAAAVKLVLYASDMATPLGSGQVFNLTTAAQRCELAVLTGLTPNTTYGFALQVNHAAQQARITVGRVEVLPVGGTGLFANDFLRVRITNDMFGGTSRAAAWTTTGLYFPHSKAADLQLLTSAASIAVEAYAEANGTDPGYLAYLVDGREQSRGANFANSSIGIEEYVLPTPPVGAQSMRSVTVRGVSYAVTPPAGLYARAFYVPRYSNTTIRPRTSAQQLVIVGDSISVGYTAGAAGTPEFQGWSVLMRKRYPGPVLIDGFGGRAFKAGATTTAQQQAFAQTIGLTQPTDVINALGLVDYLQAQWSAATFGTAYAAWLDFQHAVCPWARIWSMTPIHSITETANGQGSTLDDYSNQIITVAGNASRVPWSNSIDARAAAFPQVGAGDTVDGLHPSIDGYAKEYLAIASILNTAGVF